MTFVYDHSVRFYKAVPASTTLFLDYVPALNEKLLIVNAGLSSSAVPSTIACIVWDPLGTPELILSSYGEANQTDLNITKTGDGVTPIRINLTNDLEEIAYLGGYWQGMRLA